MKVTAADLIRETDRVCLFTKMGHSMKVTYKMIYVMGLVAS